MPPGPPVYLSGIAAVPLDLALGAFSDTPPWILDPDALAWRRGLDAERARARADVLRLLTSRRLPPLRRLSGAVGRIAGAIAVWAVVERGRPSSRRAISRRLRRAFERLGPTYIKLGQIVSSGEGLFPEELVSEFKLLRDQVPAESFDDVRAVVEADLGRPLDAVFARFDRTPLAAASIAQVHAARLVTGEEVVVKVQRPRVAALVRDDLAAMAWLGPRLVGRIPVAALANPPALVDVFAETIVEELDFRLEAENMLDIARVLAATAQRAMVVPRPHPTLVTRRVLVMERLGGFAFDDVDAMHEAGIDTEALLRAGLISFLEGAVLHGVFHGDLHGGNLFVMGDGRTALLDFGITGRLSEPKRVAFLRLLMAGGSGDVRGQVEALRDLGAFPADVDVHAVIADLGLDRPVKDPTTMSADELLGDLREIVRKLLAYGARIPKELMLLVKNMMFLDGATATLAPDLDIVGEVTGVYAYFASRHGERIARELGLDPSAPAPVDVDALKALYGLTPDVERVTYHDLRARRELIARRMRDHRRGG